MDTCGWDCLCAGPAFNIGILYGNLDETYDLISKWEKNKIINAYLEAPKKVLILNLWVKISFIGLQLCLNYQKKV